jgi:capsid protein
MSTSDDGKKPGERMNFVDRAVSFFNAEAGLRRMAARQILHEFGYNDKPHRRGDSGGMTKNANSESWANHRDRIKAMWDARDLVRYDWIGGVIARIVLYVCGEVRLKSNTGDPEIDAIYDAYFADWAGEDVDEDNGQFKCDITGRHPFSKLVQTALFSMLVDGDHGTVFRRKPLPGEEPDEATGPVCLQQIEADRIGSPIEGIQSETYIGGLTLDPVTGAVNSYRIYRRTRHTQYTDPQEIEPHNFIHLWDPDRGDQYRGVTHLLRLLNDCRDIREWIEGEKIAGKTQSQWAALVGTKDPYSKTGASAWEGKTATGTPTQSAEWGKILKLAEGESFSLLAPPNRPSGGFLAFIQVVIRKIATSLDLPYGLVWDLAMLGGVTARIEVRFAQRRINYWQRLLLTRLIRRVRREVLAYGIAVDGLPAHPRWKKFDAHFGPWIVTDAGYETQSDMALVQAGFMSAADVAAKQSRDIEEVFLRNATTVKAAQRVATDTGVPIELFAGGWLKDATQLLAAMQTPPSPPPEPPEPGSLAAVGERGAAQIIEILTKVSTGELDRESAIATLVTVYKMLPEQAMAIVPEQQSAGIIKQD